VVPWLHVDVMDGHYVPNITIGPPVVRSLRAATDRYLDCHLMITDPRTYAPQFVDARGGLGHLPPGGRGRPARSSTAARAGRQVGVAIKPAHPLSMVEELLPHVDLLLVMTVEPGFGGRRSCPTRAEDRRGRALARRARRPARTCSSPARGLRQRRPGRCHRLDPRCGPGGARAEAASR
jgi:ribulose-phosphate 3-epimerase